MRYLLILIFSINYVVGQVSFNENAQDLGIVANCDYTFLGNGISFYDYDNDGWDDISIASAEGDPVRFFKNINGYYVEQYFNFLNNDQQNKQITWVDIDNDGDNDLFITSDNSGNRLFENLGNMIFEDITSTTGMLTENLPYYGASWGDYNNDGYLDVFISVRDNTVPNVLYKNNGNKTFTLVNNEAGLLNLGMMSFCSAFLDYNNDGYQDIYVSNDKYVNRNLLYKNNGDGTFTEVAIQAGADVSIDAMTVTVEDVNYDGWLDIYITNDPNDSVLLINNTDGTFTDMAQAYNVTFNSTGWGAVFLDADNDKDLDLYVSGESNGSILQSLSSAFYINNNNGTFTLNNSSVPNDFAYSYGNAIGDINNDGYPEIVVNNITHNNIFLWENISPQTNNWLKVKLEGTVSNRQAIGSFIEISINGDKQYRYTLCGEGYLSQNSASELFGLGNATTIDYVKVKWLSGIEDILYNVSANQQLNILEGSALSINDNIKNKTRVYPNPTHNLLNVDSDNPLVYVEITNSQGQKIFSKYPNSSNTTIDLSTYNSGLYFLKIKTNKSTQTSKIFKQ